MDVVANSAKAIVEHPSIAFDDLGDPACAGRGLRPPSDLLLVDFARVFPGRRLPVLLALRVLPGLAE